MLAIASFDESCGFSTRGVAVCDARELGGGLNNEELLLLLLLLLLLRRSLGVEEERLGVARFVFGLEALAEDFAWWWP